MDNSGQPPRQRPIVRRGNEALAGARAGDQRLRLARPPEPEQIAVRPPVHRRRTWHPAVIFIYSFVGLILIGTLLLSLPVSSASGQWTPILTALFTATSAVCLTGLVVVDTGTYWSTFGQVVILLLFQMGGLGFMTSATLLLLLVGYSPSLRQRLLLREALGGGALGSVIVLARKIVLFTLITEAVGAIVLTIYFLQIVEPALAVWWGVFHSVSGFNNAGFDLIGGFRSLIPFNRDPILLLTIAYLMIAGALSYTVVNDILRERRFVRLSLDTKLVLVTTAGLLTFGTIILVITEWSNPFTFGPMNIGHRILNAFFLSAARTGGFSPVDVGHLTDESLLILMALMFIGGSAASTAGGIKIQTFGVLFFAIISSIRSRTCVEAYRRRLPASTMMRAQAIALLAIAAVFLFFLLLTLTEQFAFARVLFETFSAFGTVGLSTGITPEISDAGRLILILTMFIGRLGPLALALAFAARERSPTYQWPEESVRLG